MRMQRARGLRMGTRRPKPRRQKSAVPALRRIWSKHIGLGQHLRLQARKGHRAAVVQLRPGLWLVAAVQEETLRTEVGVLPLLAPLLVTAASRAIKQKKPILPKALKKDEPPVEWADSEDVQAMQQGECGC